MHRQPPDRFPPREQIRRLKERRDTLLSTACNRQERERILQEVREINRVIQALLKKRG